jgi:hypothetical protein
MAIGSPRTTAHLRTPRAAAIAGLLFSVLLLVAFLLLRMAVPADPRETGAWLRTDAGTVALALAGTVALALNLIPFAGIAFLWFIGVLRDRLGQTALAWRASMQITGRLVCYRA